MSLSHHFLRVIIDAPVNIERGKQREKILLRLPSTPLSLTLALTVPRIDQVHLECIRYEGREKNVHVCE